MSLIHALGDVVVEALERDPRRIVMGEDVLDGGMLGLSQVPARRDDLRARLVSTPLTPSSLPGYAAGLAMSGYRPLVILASATALVDGLASLREGGRLGWRSGDTLAPEVTFLAPFGPGFGLGSDGTEAVDALLATVPGLRLVCLGRAHEGPALLRAVLDPNARAPTTVILLPRTLLLQELGDHSVAKELGRAPGQANEIRAGGEATVVAWGPTVELASAAVAALDRDVRIVDLGGLSPVDPAVLATAAETGKVVIVHAGPRTHGIAAELAALVAEHGILHLDAPVVRVGGVDAPVAAQHEMQALPRVDTIRHAIEQVLNY